MTNNFDSPRFLTCPPTAPRPEVSGREVWRLPRVSADVFQPVCPPLDLLLPAAASRTLRPRGGFRLQAPIEEIRRRVISSQPVLMPQEVVYFVRKDQLFKLDAVFAELANQIDCLAERHVAVVVPVNQQNRRFPLVYRGYRRRHAREL